MQPFIVIGDKTSHGGTVVGGAAAATTLNKAIARVGDKVTCPKCGNNTIATGDSTMIVMGQPVARHGDKTACGATLISSQGVTLSEHSSDGGSGAAANAFFANTGNSSSSINQNQDLQSYDRYFQIKNNQTGEALANMGYRLTLPDGTTVEGTTDMLGFTDRIASNSEQPVKIEVFP
jgi:uncharacterized Zn-binding protein involved in type VI secretion